MKELFGARILRPLFALGILGALLAAGCGGNDDEAPPPPGSDVLLEKAGGDEQVGETGRELAEPVVVRVHDGAGRGIEGATVAFAVTAGGGSVSSPSAVTDADGEASVRWSMGAPPVWNRLRASTGDDAVEFTAWADPGERPDPDVILEGGTLDFGKEDLAFIEGRGLFLGSPGAILNLPTPGSSPVEVDLTGEAVYSPAGIAFGATGDLYICENGGPWKSVKRLRPSGLCEVLSDGFGGEPFGLPNYIAVHSSGDLFVSSTCDNMIYRISPSDGRTREFLAIPGPNGLAFDAEEAYLYILTENPAVFCSSGPNVRGGLYRVPVSPDGTPGELETLVEGFALAGDGIAFDEEGNLYVVFTVLLQGGPDELDDSGVFVYTPDGRFHKFFTVNILKGEIITNIAFGVEPFDPYSLYCYGFTGRLYRVEVGIRGRPIP